MKQIIIIRILIISLLFSGIIMSSCGYKQRYLRDIAKLKLDSIDRKFQPEYKVQPNDVLYIRVVGFNKSVTELFNAFNESNTNGGIMSMDNYSFFNGYTVSDSGMVKVPVIGDIYVKDSTINSIQKLIQEKIDKLVNEATVIVKLASFKLIMLGEVNSPGIKHISNNRVTVLEAMAMAGDLKEFAERRNVLIIRPTEKGHLTFRIDLTDPKIISSQDYYLLPNDVVYVEARKVKSFRQGWSNASIIMSILSSLVVVYGYFKLF